ncbi:hypothetical protein BU15DRAFT_72659 [Melanogaster broomeanus]|nr:hypothetical protein BU15DRAFT_72659 [Melanogaster broomeanus]
MPPVEITYFPVSENFKSLSSSFHEPLSQMRNVPGLKSYVGHETEDPSVLFWVNDWASKGANEAFLNHPEYPALAAATRPSFAAQPTRNYVNFDDTKALRAPITEFVTCTLKEGKTMAELELLLQELHQKLGGTPGFYGDSWAVVTGKPNVYHGILGWETVEAHWVAVGEGPLKEVIDRVKELADLWLVHAALKSFSG